MVKSCVIDPSVSIWPVKSTPILGGPLSQFKV